MTFEEVDHCGKQEQTRRIFIECKHEPGRGECTCDDDGEVSHRGASIEIGDWYHHRDRWPVNR